MSKLPRFVYFMKPVGMDGPIKIGCSHIPQDRLKAMSSWSPFPLEIIVVTPGSLKDETFLHRCFAYCHLHYEWFQPSPLLLETINKISTGTNVAELRLSLNETGSVRKRQRRQGTGTRRVGLFWESPFIAKRSPAPKKGEAA